MASAFLIACRFSSRNATVVSYSWTVSIREKTRRNVSWDGMPFFKRRNFLSHRCFFFPKHSISVQVEALPRTARKASRIIDHCLYSGIIYCFKYPEKPADDGFRRETFFHGYFQFFKNTCIRCDEFIFAIGDSSSQSNIFRTAGRLLLIASEDNICC